MSGDVRASRRLKHKYKRLFTKLEYLYSELDYHKEEHGYRKQEFQEAFLEFCDDHGYDCSTRKVIETYEQKQTDPYKVRLDDQEQQEIIEDLFDEPDEDDSERDLKNLYKKIAVQTHPDKLMFEEIEAIKEKKKRLFLEAKEALEQENFYRMSQIASELGLELPEPNDQQLKWMRTEKKKIEKVLEGITQTFEWVYGEENQSAPKINLFYRYVDIIGCVKLEKEG